MNVNRFNQQIQFINGRLANLSRGADALSQEVQKDLLLPVALKELGIVSERLQLAVNELQQQHKELAIKQELLEAQRQHYQAMFDLAPDGYLLTDASGKIEAANLAAAKMLKVSPQFLVGKQLFLFVAEEQRQEFYAQLMQLQQAQQEMQEWTVRLALSSGEFLNVEITVAIATDKDGKTSGMRVCMRKSADVGQSFDSISLEGIENDASLNLPKYVYLKGEIIPLKPQVVWQVCQGVVKLSTMSETGEEVLVGLAASGMPFGADLTSLQTYQATALSHVQLISCSFMDIAASPSLTANVLLRMKQRLQQTEAFLTVLGQRRVKNRFYRLLQLLKQEIGQPVDQGTRLSIRFTHQELAEACSTSRVTITRLLGKLQEQDKIIIDATNHIVIKEDHGLFDLPPERIFTV